MTGVERPQLGWRVVSREWGEFCEQVEERWGTTDLYSGLELERAWREFRERHDAEEYADRLLDAAGLSKSDGKKKKPESLKPMNALDTEKCWVRVHADVKREMKQYAAAEDVKCQEVLRWVVNWHCEGGREGRLTDKLRRAAEHVEGLAADANTERDETLSSVEKKTIAIARELGDQFTEDELDRAIREAGGVTSDPSIRKYRARVFEHKGVVPHPAADHLYIPESEAERMQVSGIIDRLRNGDGAVPAFTANDLAKAAASELGIKATNKNEDELAPWMQRAVDHLPHKRVGDSDTFEPQNHREDSESERAEDEAEKALAALDAAEAVTDGGTPPRSG